MTLLLAFLLALSTPCEFEDSTNCHWSTQGNSQGQHFIDVQGTTIYL